MGGRYGQLHSRRDVAVPRSSPPHQQFGTGSSPQIPSSFSGQPTTGRDPDQIRQLNSGGPHKQTRRHQGPISVQEGGTDPPVGPVQGMVPASQAHSRKRKRHGRPSEQARQAHSDGMDHHPPSTGEDLVTMGQTDGGPLCDQVLEEAPHIRVPGARPTSMAHGRTSTGPTYKPTPFPRGRCSTQ